MPHKRAGYDAACYYDGKLLGRCTKADSDAYTLLMNACGGEAARVLREYAYFSPELDGYKRQGQHGPKCVMPGSFPVFCPPGGWS